MFNIEKKKLPNLIIAYFTKANHLFLFFFGLPTGFFFENRPFLLIECRVFLITTGASSFEIRLLADVDYILDYSY